MSHSVLIIDDNDELRENTGELLSLAGYDTYTTVNGMEGLKIAREKKPDLILCDIMMPVLDGYGVLQALENIPELTGIPFIFMTAKAGKSDFRKGMDLGADDYLTKPFTGEELLSIVTARLKKKDVLQKSLAEKEHKDQERPGNGKMLQDMNILHDPKTIKHIRKKDMLFMEGDSPNFLFLMVSGKIKVYKSNESGKEYIINIYKAGDFLGHVSLLQESKYKESAVAIEDSEVALLPKQAFFEMINHNPDVAVQFIKLLSKDFADAEEKLIKLAYDSARKRVAEAILFVSKKYQEEGRPDSAFAMHRENISALSGISPESVSRHLTDFKEEGLIEINQGAIKIIQFKKLEATKN
ncbi:MAG: response regulator [Bacteroidia bacterium]